MPNWCFNRLTVTGPTEDIRSFREDAENDEEPLSVHNFLPLPEELEMQEAGDQWYSYMNEEIGTKWDVCEPKRDIDKERRLLYSFDTAWGPPAEWVVLVSREYPRLKFKLWFEETGMWFRGELIIQNENCLLQRDLTEEMTKEDEEQEKGEGE